MSAAPSPAAGPENATRPTGFILLVADCFLVLSITGWVRAGQGLLGWNLQVELLGRPLAVYLVLSGLFWGLAGLPAVWFLFRRSEAAIPAAWVGAIFYPLAYWLERLLLVHSPEDWANWPFMLGLTIAWLALVGFTLGSKATRAYLSKEDPSR